jgi:outer membrane protein
MKKMSLALCALALASFCAPALADDAASPWFFRAGVAYLDLQDKFTVTVGGQAIPGAALHYRHVYTPMAEIGYTFADDFAAVATLGFPPAISAYGGGSISSFGRLEATTFGPGAFSVQYQPSVSDVVHPYLGVGLSYMLVFRMQDAAVQKANLSNDLAPVVEVGSEFSLTPSYGFFLEAKKSFLSSKATGNVGGFPLVGKADLAPWVFSTGIALHFN